MRYAFVVLVLACKAAPSEPIQRRELQHPEALPRHGVATVTHGMTGMASITVDTDARTIRSVVAMREQHGDSTRALREDELAELRRLMADAWTDPPKAFEPRWTDISQELVMVEGDDAFYRVDGPIHDNGTHAADLVDALDTMATWPAATPPQPPPPPPKPKPTGPVAHTIHTTTYGMGGQADVAIDLDAHAMHVITNEMGEKAVDLTVKLTDGEMAQVVGLASPVWTDPPPTKDAADHANGITDIREDLLMVDGDQRWYRTEAMITADGTSAARLYAAIEKIAMAKLPPRR